MERRSSKKEDNDAKKSVLIKKCFNERLYVILIWQIKDNQLWRGTITKTTFTVTLDGFL